MREAEPGSLLSRLREAGLRPTSARIGVLRVIEGSGMDRICAEDVFRQMMRRGTRASVSTVYRVIHELVGHGLLLREWDTQRKALYRLKPDCFDAEPLRLVCPVTGRVVALDDPDLHARLIAAGRREGLDLVGQALTIHAECASSVDYGRRMAASFTHALDRHRSGAASQGFVHLRQP